MTLSPKKSLKRFDGDEELQRERPMNEGDMIGTRVTVCSSERKTGGEGHLYSVSVGQQELRAPCPQHLKALSTGVQSAT